MSFLKINLTKKIRNKKQKQRLDYLVINKRLQPLNKKHKLSIFFILSLEILLLITYPLKVNAAEKIRLSYGLLNFSLSVESLEIYAETGKITPEFEFYTKFLNERLLLQLRHWLQKDWDRNFIELHKYTHSPQGEELLQEIGNVVTTHSQTNGFYALRGALIQAASQSEDWTILDVIQQFPTEYMQINTKELFKLKTFWQESNIGKQ